MNKKVEEIKDCIDELYGCDCAYYGVEGLAIAEHLYKAGYRKLSEGYWIEYTDPGFMESDYDVFYRCSVCGMCHFATPNYCFNCGAKMKGGESDA